MKLIPYIILIFAILHSVLPDLITDSIVSETLQEQVAAPWPRPSLIRLEVNGTNREGVILIDLAVLVNQSMVTNHAYFTNITALWQVDRIIGMQIYKKNF